MSARGALRAGAGLVTVASPSDALAVNAAALTAVMVHGVDTPVEFAEMLTHRRFNACVIGPGAGVGERTRDFVLTALSANRGIVLDADDEEVAAFFCEPKQSEVAGMKDLRHEKSGGHSRGCRGGAEFRSAGVTGIRNDIQFPRTTHNPIS